MPTHYDEITGHAVSQAIVALVRQEQNVHVSNRHLMVNAHAGSGGEKMYVIIALRQDIDMAVSRVIATIKYYVPSGAGVWVLSDVEVRRLLHKLGPA